MTEDAIQGRVLVVDDEEAMVALLTGWIETLGFTIESASNGAEALDAARRFQPDVILMDAMMPVMGGFEALLAVKRDPVLQHIPVLFLTVRHDIQDIVNALDIGAADYLSKPFKPQELLARLRSVVRLKQQQDDLRHHAERAGQQRDRLRSWIEHLPQAYLALDGDGRALAWNRRAHEATGLPAERVLGRPVEELIQPAEGTPAEAPWRASRPCDGPATFLAGEPVAVRLQGSPIPAEEGGGYGLLLTF